MSQENKDFAYSDLTDKEWLNPLSVMELQEAVLHQRTLVELQGKEFTIQYHDVQIDDHGVLNGGKVFVKVVGNYAPCGWFGVNTLLSYEFESDHDKHL